MEFTLTQSLTVQQLTEILAYINQIAIIDLKTINNIK